MISEERRQVKIGCKLRCMVSRCYLNSQIDMSIERKT